MAGPAPSVQMPVILRSHVRRLHGQGGPERVLQHQSATGGFRRQAQAVRRLPAGSDLAKAIYSALAMVKERREIEEFLERAREMRYTDIEEGVMTFAQEVREEGEKRGLEKGETLGKIKDKQEIVKRLLNRKFGLSEEEAARIDGIEDFEALDAALDEIIDAEDKRNVLKKLGL